MKDRDANSARESRKFYARRDFLLPSTLRSMTAPRKTSVQYDSRSLEYEAPANRIRPKRMASDEKREHAAELFKQGFGYVRAAAILSLPIYTVRDWNLQWKQGKFKTSLSPNLFQYSEKVKKKAIALRYKGVSWRDLEKITGISATTIRKWVEKDQQRERESTEQ